MASDPVFIKSLTAKGILSFGPGGFELPLKRLNVLIGPNGSGKSNLVELLSLLKASPSNLPGPMKEMGGVGEWFWKGEDAPDEAVIESIISQPPKAKQDIRHRLTITLNGPRFELADEQIEYESPDPGHDQPFYFYNFRRGYPFLKEFDYTDQEESFDRTSIRPEESILSQVNLPNRYPILSHLQHSYRSICLFRNWQFGPNAAIRRETEPNADNTFLRDGGLNLDVVLSTFRGAARKKLIEHLQQLYADIEDFAVPVGTSGTMLYLEEKGGRSIPKTRLSDGTLRYLCLLAILLHPTPPPLIVIEEPEQGLHLDALLQVTQLLESASERTQIIVTTHSRLLVDAMTHTPESVIVTERHNGCTEFRRLNPDDLGHWLKEFSLGDLWVSGEIGGNRW